MNLCFCQECTGPHIFFGLTHWETAWSSEERTGSALSVFLTKLAPAWWLQLPLLSPCRMGGGRETMGKDVPGWPNTLASVSVSLSSQGKSLWKDFGDLWRPGRISQSGYLCIWVQWPSWLSQEPVSAWSISNWEATTFLAVRLQSVVNPPCPLVHCYYLMCCN